MTANRGFKKETFRYSRSHPPAMKVLLVLALAVALVAGTQVSFAPEFAAGKTYKYKYEGYLLGGLPEEGLARAGMKIQSKILIGAADPNSYIIKLEDPMISEYSGIWPKEVFRPATKLTSALSAQLLTPVKFEYANGVIGKVYAPAGISTAVLNIFRGVLNIFQMNIKKTQNVYNLQETGVKGVCKTHYVLSEDSKADRLHLTKTTDLNHCTDRIHMDFGMAGYTDKCPECVTRGKVFAGAISINYVMKPSASGTLILEATATELLQYSPVNIVNGAFQMEAKQTVTFVDIKKTPLEPVKADYIHRGSLKYEFGTELLQTPIQLLRITNAEAQIVETLNNLVSLNLGEAHEDSPLKFIELIQLLRVARYESIEALWSQFKSKSEHRHWMLSSIPAIGTHVALKFIKEKVVAGEVTSAEAAQAIISSAHLVTADIEAIKLQEGLAMTPKIKENAALREITMLGFGTMVHKYCVENPSCPSELVRPIHDIVVSAVERRDNDELSLALKVLGNAGHPSSLKPIMKLLPGFGSSASNLEHRVHVDAALALRKIAKREPKLIQDMAVQLFMDRTLDPELRMVAAIVLFDTKLPLGLVTTLAQSLLKEPNLQVASFAYSYMKAFTKTTTPDHSTVAAACNVAIRILSPKFERLSYRYSRAFHYDHYYNPWMLGAAASAYYINDVASVLPRNVMAKARIYLSGVFVDVLEFGARSEGVQEALLKVRDVPESANRITKMKQVLKALTEWRAKPSRQPLGSLYVKVFGNEVAFANIDKEMIEKITEFAAGPEIRMYGKQTLDALMSGYSLKYSQPILAIEVRCIFPSSLGLPMELSLYTAGVTAASVEVQATISPPPPEDFHPVHLLKSDISMKALVAPSVSLHTYAVMGVNNPFIQATVMSRAKVHTVIPKKMEARFDVVKGYFNYQFLPVEGVKTIASALLETVAIARDVEDLEAAKITPVLPFEPFINKNTTSMLSKTSNYLSDSLSASSELLPLQLQSQIVSNMKIPKPIVKKMCATTYTYGIEACIDIRSRNATFLRNTPIYAIIGNHSLLVNVTPAAGPSIERIEIEVQIGEKAAEKIIKVVNLSEEEEILEDKNVLMKLKKILVPGLKNSTKVSSSSSSSSRSSSSRSRRSSSTSSKTSSSSSSSRPKTKMLDLADSLNKTSKISSSSSSSQHLSRSSSSSRSSLRSSILSSSSSSSSSMSKQELYEMNFTKDHIHQHSLSTEHLKSKSSASSFEYIYNKAKYLSNTVNPAVTVLVRAIRTDHKNQGYQITAYYDRLTARVQIIVANLTENDNWRICADSMMLSYHKVMTRVTWGIECKQYNTSITAETGRVEKEPAVRVKLTWERLPNYLKKYASRVSNYLTRIVEDNGVNRTKVANDPKEIKLTVAVANETSLNVTMKTPKNTFYKLGWSLPFYLPVNNTAAELQAYQNSWIEQITYVLTKSNAAECSVVKDTVVTFNNKKYKTEMPHSCHQVLAQDCTSEMKFIVLLKRDQTTEQNEISVKIEMIDVDMYLKDNAVVVKVNGVEISLNNLPYQHPTAADIQIREREDGVSLHAPSHGLQEVFFSLNKVQVKVVDWMRGQTCGLCGKADGEVRQEYSTPNERVSRNATSFAHSWVLPAKSCHDTSECYMQLDSVKLEKQISLEGEESKCYTVEPVLRCLPGCLPVRTTSVTVGYHCVPLESNLNRSDGLSSIYEKSIDVSETAESHL
ncbi:Vitellogenin-2, partial [Characodon lateralis]|nr:Vitellogenin-2 [Characodon lateralis]